MAVRCQLLCILPQRSARRLFASTHSLKIAYAPFCDRVQRAAKPQKTDSKSAGPCGHGGFAPPGTNKTTSSHQSYSIEQLFIQGLLNRWKAGGSWPGDVGLIQAPRLKFLAPILYRRALAGECFLVGEISEFGDPVL